MDISLLILGKELKIPLSLPYTLYDVWQWQQQEWPYVQLDYIINGAFICNRLSAYADKKMLCESLIAITANGVFLPSFTSFRTWNGVITLCNKEPVLSFGFDLSVNGLLSVGPVRHLADFREYYAKEMAHVENQFFLFSAWKEYARLERNRELYANDPYTFSTLDAYASRYGMKP